MTITLHTRTSPYETFPILATVLVDDATLASIEDGKTAYIDTPRMGLMRINRLDPRYIVTLVKTRDMGVPAGDNGTGSTLAEAMQRAASKWADKHLSIDERLGLAPIAEVL